MNNINNSSKNVELQLLVNGKPIPTYGHKGKTFVEGREGTPFSLKVKNNTPNRIEAVLSVDGRSILDGETAKPDSRGYIIPAYGSYEIPGWRIDTEKCAQFIFKKGNESYAVKSGAPSTDVGVIGLMAWSEKIVPPAPQPIIIKETVIQKEPVVWPYPSYPNYWYTTCQSKGHCLGSYSSSIGNSAAFTAANNGVLRSMSVQSDSCELPVADSMNCCSAINSAAPSFELGTGWGSQTESKVGMTSFDRGEAIVQTDIYYSTAKALKKAGIRLVKETAIPTGQSSPYPSSFRFCKPPVGS